MDIEFDPAKTAANQKKHRVSFLTQSRRYAIYLQSRLKTPMRQASSGSLRSAWTRSGECWLSSILSVASGRALFPLGRQVPARRSNIMGKEYDFSKGKRGPAVSSPGKTRITIMLDNEVIEAFREQAEAKGVGYQTAINEVLRNYILEDAPLTANTLRQILRQELHEA